MVPEIYEIRKRQGSHPGLGSVLPRLPAHLQAAASGFGEGGSSFPVGIFVPICPSECVLSCFVCLLPFLPTTADFLGAPVRFPQTPDVPRFRAGRPGDVRSESADHPHSVHRALPASHHLQTEAEEVDLNG